MRERKKCSLCRGCTPPIVFIITDLILQLPWHRYSSLAHHSLARGFNPIFYCCLIKLYNWPIRSYNYRNKLKIFHCWVEHFSLSYSYSDTNLWGISFVLQFTDRFTAWEIGPDNLFFKRETFFYPLEPDKTDGPWSLSPYRCQVAQITRTVSRVRTLYLAEFWLRKWGEQGAQYCDLAEETGALTSRCWLGALYQWDKKLWVAPDSICSSLASLIILPDNSVSVFQMALTAGKGLGRNDHAAKTWLWSQS